jgi:rare lipoprotein A
MNKILAILAVMFVFGLAQPASACDNWPSCSFSEVQHNKPVKITKNTKKPKKERTLRDIPVVGDVVGAFQSGMASFYWQPQRIACGGGRFNPEAMTAAHKTLPCGSRVMVTNKRNGKSVIVTINDRGPYVAGRIIDLSKAAASAIGMVSSGTAPVSLTRM